MWLDEFEVANNKYELMKCKKCKRLFYLDDAEIIDEKTERDPIYGDFYKNLELACPFCLSEEIYHYAEPEFTIDKVETLGDETYVVFICKKCHQAGEYFFSSSTEKAMVRGCEHIVDPLEIETEI